MFETLAATVIAITALLTVAVVIMPSARLSIKSACAALSCMAFQLAPHVPVFLLGSMSALLANWLVHCTSSKSFELPLSHRKSPWLGHSRVGACSMAWVCTNHLGHDRCAGNVHRVASSAATVPVPSPLPPSSSSPIECIPKSPPPSCAASCTCCACPFPPTIFNHRPCLHNPQLPPPPPWPSANGGSRFG